MPSAESDRKDRTLHERDIDRALAADRAGRSRLRDQADQEPPEPFHTGAPNSRVEDRP